MRNRDHPKLYRRAHFWNFAKPPYINLCLNFVFMQCCDHLEFFWRTPFTNLGNLICKFGVLGVAVNQIDVQCRDHVELFLKGELWRRLAVGGNGIGFTRFLCLWFLFCGDLSCFWACGSVVAMIIEVILWSWFVYLELWVMSFVFDLCFLVWMDNCLWIWASDSFACFSYLYMYWSCIRWRLDKTN